MTSTDSDLLEQEVRKYVAAGYRLVLRTETSAQLVQPKQFSLAVAILSFLIFGIGLLIYLGYFLAQSEPTVYLSLDQNGDVIRQFSGMGTRSGVAPAGSIVCPTCGHMNLHARRTCKKCRLPLTASASPRVP